MADKEKLEPKDEPDRKSEREAKLAEALRANLRRRKGAARPVAPNKG
jgi:hypothetical protein